MASVTAFIVYLWLFVAVVLDISDVEGRRAGGGSRSSSRSSYRSRGSFGSSRAVKTAAVVALSGRVLGSSNYNMMNWRAAAIAGSIYGGPRYVRLYSHRHDMPPICTNNYDIRPDGKVYGFFICPRENETDTYLYCCGPSKREFCCDMEMARKYIALKKSGLSIGGIIGIVIAIVVVCVLSFICCKKRKQAGVIIRRFSRKDVNIKQPDPNQHNQTVPLNGPAPAYDGFTPSIPPPSYDAVAAQPSYDSVNGLPYGPPQPQPPPDIDEKSGLPMPYIGAQPYCTPYPQPGGDPPYPYPNEYSASGAPYPSTATAPYPNPGDAPYPTPGEAPYPTPGGAPYPTPGEAPYPTPGGAPYPSPGGAPYPSPGDAPYPTPGGAPYPTPGGAAYPNPGGAAYPTPGGAAYPNPGGATYLPYGSPNSDSLTGVAK